MQAKTTEKKQAFGMRLRRRAEDLNLQQADIALRLGVSPSKVGNWFQGRNLPKKDAPALAKLLGWSEEFLLHGAIPVSSETVSVDAGGPILAEALPLTEAIRVEFNALLAAAGDDTQRLHWIAEQMREHLQVPKHWRRPGRIKFTYVTPANALVPHSSETGKPLPHGVLPRHHPKPGATSAA